MLVEGGLARASRGLGGLLRRDAPRLGDPLIEIGDQRLALGDGASCQVDACLEVLAPGIEAGQFPLQCLDA